MTGDSIRVLVVDDHPLLRVGAVNFLSANEHLLVVGDTDNAIDALHLAQAQSPDVMLLDIRLKGDKNGVDLAREVRRELPNVKILVLTSFLLDPYIKAMMEVGVEGYLLKDTVPSEIAEAIRMVVGGRTVFSSKVTAKMVGGYLGSAGGGEAYPDRLTPREIEVTQLLGEGCATREMAERLGISEKGVQQHLTGIYEKLGARNRSEAIVRAVRAGIIILDDSEIAT